MGLVINYRDAKTNHEYCFLQIEFMKKMNNLKFLSKELLQKISKLLGIKCNLSNLHEKITQYVDGDILESCLCKGSVLRQLSIDQIFEMLDKETKTKLMCAFQKKTLTNLLQPIANTEWNLNFSEKTRLEICTKLNLGTLNASDFNEYANLYGVEFLRFCKVAQLKEIGKGTKDKILQFYGLIKIMDKPAKKINVKVLQPEMISLIDFSK